MLLLSFKICPGKTPKLGDKFSYFHNAAPNLEICITITTATKFLSKKGHNSTRNEAKVSYSIGVISRVMK